VSCLLLSPLFLSPYFVALLLIQFHVPDYTTIDLRMPDGTIHCILCIFDGVL
ncbi:hypothetical protein C7387_4348, partial [Yokenella regensburgei]